MPARARAKAWGNQFLANIRECDAIAHIVRCFEDDNIVHVSGKVDPASDIEVINTELALSDLTVVEKQIQKWGKQAKQGADKEAAKLVAVLEKLQPVLNEGKPAFILDSKAPAGGYQEFLMNEARYSRLTREFPERATELFERNEAAAKERYEHLLKLVELYK